ncbi:hypothetical protein DL93DRAFT_446923 [Clavulina sp. PMI_390]|nr:hypothetical protein DL93DRAFT_446923 [Clavulina sp. PMI_390]
MDVHVPLYPQLSITAVGNKTKTGLRLFEWASDRRVSHHHHANYSSYRSMTNNTSPSHSERISLRDVLPVLRNICHIYFTLSYLPPPAGVTYRRAAAPTDRNYRLRLPCLGT